MAEQKKTEMNPMLKWGIIIGLILKSIGDVVLILKASIPALTATYILPQTLAQLFMFLQVKTSIFTIQLLPMEMCLLATW